MTRQKPPIGAARFPCRRRPNRQRVCRRTRPSDRNAIFRRPDADFLIEPLKNPTFRSVFRLTARGFLPRASIRVEWLPPQAAFADF